MTDTYELYTGAEINAYATADTARRAHNVTALGNGENPDDGAAAAKWLDEDADKTGAESACPDCGERRVDYLETYEDEVTCTTCGTHYRLPQGAH